MERKHTSLVRLAGHGYEYFLVLDARLDGHLSLIEKQRKALSHLVFRREDLEGAVRVRFDQGIAKRLAERRKRCEVFAVL